MAQPKKFLTVEEAIDYFNTLSDDSNESIVDICQLPPDESGCITDEEEVNDNSFEPTTPGDVCGQIEVLTNKSPDTSDEELDTPSTSKEKSRIKKKTAKKLRKQPNWKKCGKFQRTLNTIPSNNIIETFPELSNLTPTELFYKFLPSEYLEKLTEFTKLYALQKGHSIDVGANDIRQFLGLLLFSGYHSVPDENSYWSTQEDLNIPIVSTVMPRNKFRMLKKYFHIVDNTKLEPGDKFGKISPFYEEIGKNFRQFGIFHENLSIDESMIPYYGHHSAKMFIRGKPIRFGFKVWMLCSSNGYPYAMSIYGGKSSKNENLPLGSKVVSELLSFIDNPEEHIIFFDNFFTSHSLLIDLSNKGFKAIGTVRDSRTGKCPLKTVKEMSKLQRGEFDYRCDGEVYMCRWNDSSVVTIGSNFMTHEPLGRAKRYVRAQKKKVDVPQPHIIQLYNEGMGGVDLLDQLLGSYRPKLRTKKWYWNLFINALNMVVAAGWILHTDLHKNTTLEMTHLNFRREITLHLLRAKPQIHVVPGPRAHQSTSARKSDTHYIVSSSQGRCVVCQKNTTNMCFECKKRLHVHCFPQYHGH